MGWGAGGAGEWVLQLCPQFAKSRWHARPQEVVIGPFSPRGDELSPDAVPPRSHRPSPPRPPPPDIEAGDMEIEPVAGAQPGPWPTAAVRPARRTGLTGVRVALPARAIWTKKPHEGHRDRVEPVRQPAYCRDRWPPRTGTDRWTRRRRKSTASIKLFQLPQKTGHLDHRTGVSAGSAGVRGEARQVAHSRGRAISRACLNLVDLGHHRQHDLQLPPAPKP